MSAAEREKALRSADALHRLREVENRQAQGRLYLKQMEIQRLKGQIEGLKQRRSRLLGRRDGQVLRERLLLDALLRTTLERGFELEALNLQAAVLLADYRAAHGRRDAAASLRDRRRAEREARLERRVDEVTNDILAARRLRERVRLGESLRE